MVLPARRVLRGTRDCDVLVVGAGISGALVAEALSATGLHVMICDRRPPLHGSTLASTAMLLYEIDTPLVQLIAKMGRRNAERIWHRSRCAVDALRERARHLSVDAELEEHDTLFLQGNVLDARQLRTEGEARMRAGFETAYFTASQVQAGHVRHRAARGIARLRRAVRESARTGGRLPACGGSAWRRAVRAEEIIEAKSRASGVHALTRSGHRIHARHLVFATGYELPKMVPAQDHRVASTWAHRHASPAAHALAGAEPHLGGKFALSLPANHPRWSRAVRWWR